MQPDEAAQAFGEFAAIIKELRTPGTGCPWDLEQDHKSLRPYLVEEAYEVLDAIDDADDGALREELGDLLLQVVLHAQVADDRGAFSITEVVRSIAKKMVRRHPHVFGSIKVSGTAEVLQNWEQIKAAETIEKGGDESHASALARLPKGLPALLRAQRLGEKAAKVKSADNALAAAHDKARTDFAALEEEIRIAAAGPAAVEQQSPPNEPREKLDYQLGKLLFSLCQLARSLGLNAEDSLRNYSRRFVEGFRQVEQLRGA